jgi:dihydropteroate synthase
LRTAHNGHDRNRRPELADCASERDRSRRIEPGIDDDGIGSRERAGVELLGLGGDRSDRQPRQATPAEADEVRVDGPAGAREQKAKGSVVRLAHVLGGSAASPCFVHTTRDVAPNIARCGTGGLVREPIEQRFPRPSVMGIVNVTPDSFSDGGVNYDAEDAISSARRMVAEGAAIVDVGGESTRPGSAGVSLDEELRRVLPVLEAVEGELPLSIDTAKAEVARRALALGAELVNDVTALRGDPELAGVVAGSGAYLCLMHMQGEPRTMQANPTYDDVVSEVAAFLEERLQFAVAKGVSEERVCLDPGIGFGKTVEHNFELLRRLDELVALGRPIVIGFSRKRSLGRVLGDPEATTGPLSASIAAAVTAYERGATILRVHDVKEHVEALTVARAVQ